jgi:HAMP domain-containing protein
MAPRLTALLVSVAVLAGSSAAAEVWSKARISRLPDSAFAVVESSPDGR